VIYAYIYHSKITAMKTKLLAFTLLLTLSSSLLTVSAQIISTVAGNGTQNFSGDGGQATAAQMNYTSDMAFDASGNMYIADNFNNRIRKVNTSGIITTMGGNGTAGYSGNGGPATVAELNSPSGVDADAAGNVYIVDQGNSAVRIINSSGIIKTFAGTGTSGFSGDGGQATNAELYQPDKGAIDPNTGNFYIADYSNHRIRMVNTNGIITTVVGNGTSGFSGDGGQATAAELASPVGVFIDNSGNIYIGDYGNNRVRMVNTLGVISTLVGTGVASSTGDGGPATAATIDNPAGIVKDNWGNLYVNEFFGYKIRVVNSSGTISTFAGTGISGYSGDGGPATAAMMTGPYGLRMDASGSIFFADLTNSVVRKISGGPLAVNTPASMCECSVYPNPSNGQFQIVIASEAKQSLVDVYNMLGEKVYSNELLITNYQLLINMSNQPAGIYLLKLKTEDGSIITRKIEVTH
jgi:streptogramin lyase